MSMCLSEICSISIGVNLLFISLLHANAEPEGGMSPLPVRKDSGGNASLEPCVGLHTLWKWDSGLLLSI